MKSAEGNFNYEPIESNQEEDAMEGNADKYCDLYRDMAALIGDSAVRKLWKAYGGINVTFLQGCIPKITCDSTSIKTWTR